MPFLVKAAARSSPLSRAQVVELQTLYPDVQIDCQFVETTGDLDKKTSLRSLDKTDFFTREIDKLVLSGVVDIGIHSAKDLPDPLPEGLELIALTEGVDPSDSLVMRHELEVEVVATSSERREEMVKQLYPDAQFVDIRGTIEERLAKLDCGEVDGVVIAEAALIRLGLTHRKRLKLPGETAPLQGRLAVIAQKGNDKLKDYFAVECTSSNALSAARL